MKRKDIIPLLIIGAFVTILLRGTLRAGFPDWFENYGSYMSQVMLVRDSGGTWFTQNWYFGYEIGRYYPPMAILETLLIGSIAGDYSLAFNLLAYAAFIGMGAAFYVFLRHEFESEWAALVAVLLFITSHSVITGVQGFYWEVPHLIGFALIPILLISVRSALQKQSLLASCIAGVVFGAIVLHNILAGTEAVIFTAIYVVKLMLSGWRPTKQTAHQVMLMGMSVLAVAGWWLVPAIFPEGLGIYTKNESFSLQGLVTLSGDAEKHDHFYLLSLLSVPGVLAVSGLLSFFRKPKAVDWFALIILGVATVMVVVPAPQGWRYIVDMSLGISILSGRLFERLVLSGRKYAAVIAALIGVAVLLHAGSVADKVGSRIQVSQTSYKSSIVYIVENEVHSMMQPDDVVYIAYADGFRGGPMAFNLFFPEAAQVGGGSFVGNRSEDAKRIGAYVKSGDMPKSLDRLLQDHGVTYLVVNRSTLEKKDAFDVLLRRYQIVYEYDYMTVLYTGYHTARPVVAYEYANTWRVVGIIASLLAVFVIEFYVIQRDMRQLVR